MDHEAKNVESVITEFEWTISDFSSKNSYDNVRHNFTFGGLEWELVLYPFGKDNDSEDFVSLYLYLSTIRHTIAEFHVSIINIFNDYCNNFTDSATLRYGESLKCSEFIRRKDLVARGLLVNDQLKISCKMINESHQNFEKVTEPTNLCHKLGGMDISHLEVDTHVTVMEHVFDVHRFVLSQSQVFAAMFRHNMKESSTNSITIDDYEPAVFREFLRYLYTNRIEEMDGTGYQELYACAEKYAVAGLKTVCERALREKIMSIDNVVEILLFADTYNSESLKRDALKFITKMASRVAAATGWKKLFSNHALMDEVFNQLASCITTDKLKNEI